MNKKYAIRIDVFNMLLRFMIGFTVVGLIGLVYTDNAAFVWKSLILFQATVLSFLISKFARHIWIYIVLHILLIAGYYYLADHMILRVLYLLYLIMYALIQFSLDLNDHQRNTPIPFLVVFFIMYFVCKYRYPNDLMLNQFFFYFTIIFGLIYVVNRHQINYFQYLSKHVDKANIPLKQINMSNNFFITGFIVLCSMVMLLFTKLPMGRMFYLLWIVIRNVLRTLLSGLTKQPPEVPSEEESILSEDQLNGLEELEYPIKEPSEFWQAVTKVLLVVSFTIFIALVISLIVYGLYKIYRLYYQTKGQVKEEEKIEVISPFEKFDIGFKGARRNL